MKSTHTKQDKQFEHLTRKGHVMVCKNSNWRHWKSATKIVLY